MPRYIDADIVVERLSEIQPFAGNKAANAAINLCKDVLRNAPTIDPESLRARGEWVADGIADNIFRCSKCGNDAPVSPTCGTEYKSDFCPTCGAKMEVSEDA